MLKKFFGQKNNIWDKSKFLLLLGLIGVFLILLGDLTGTFVSRQPTSSNSSSRNSSNHNQSMEEQLENQLAATLSQIAGVGEVKVKLTLASSEERIYARNKNQTYQKTTEDNGEGKKRENFRNNTENKVVVLNSGGGEKPAVKKRLKPQIKGVLVVAEGASHSEVKAELIRAVKVGLGIPSYKIVVLPKAD